MVLNLFAHFFRQGRAGVKRSTPAGSFLKQPKQDLAKDDGKSGKVVSRTPGSSSAGERDFPIYPFQGRQDPTANIASPFSGNGSIIPASTKGSTPSTRSLDTHGSEPKMENVAAKPLRDDMTEASDVQRQPSRPVHSPRPENTTRSVDKLPKRASPVEELDRLSKRRKGEIDSRDLEAEVRGSARERAIEPRLTDKLHPVDVDKPGSDEHKPTDRSKDKGNERYDRDYRERLERPDKSRGDDILPEKSRDRSMERYGRERSVERGVDRLTEKTKDERNKDDRGKLRYNEASIEKSHGDDRFHGQSLPPPPPLPPHVVPQSVNVSRRDEDADRRIGTGRHTQRLSPRHDDRERRRSEESLVSQDDPKRRREDEFRERKREERDGLSSMKVCFSTTDSDLVLSDIYMVESTHHRITLYIYCYNWLNNMGLKFNMQQPVLYE